MNYCTRVRKLRTGLLSVCFAASATTFAQTCYPTSIMNNSNGNKTNVGYDDKNNIVSLTYTLQSTVTTYSVTIEKTPAGYRKIFITKVDDSPAMAFTPARTVMTYNNPNRLELVEGSNDNGLKVSEKYIYNSNGQLIRIDEESSFKDPSGKISSDHGQITYSYSNTSSKNPTEVNTYGVVNDKPGLGLIEHDVFTYDDKKAMSDEFPFSSGPFRTFAANNILTADITYVSSNQKAKQSYTYTYNTNGYPTSKTYIFSGASTTDSYTYLCK
jgi:hypothetical protein